MSKGPDWSTVDSSLHPWTGQEVVLLESLHPTRSLKVPSSSPDPVGVLVCTLQTLVVPNFIISWFLSVKVFVKFSWMTHGMYVTWLVSVFNTVHWEYSVLCHSVLRNTQQHTTDRN